MKNNAYTFQEIDRMKTVIDAFLIILLFFICLSMAVGIMVTENRKHRLLLAIVFIAVVSFTVMAVKHILNVSSLGRTSLGIAIGVIIIPLGIGAKFFFGKKKPKVWKTPGGTASSIYLKMLKEQTLVAVGSESDRNRFRDGLLYTLLYSSPASAQIVFLSSKIESFAQYKKLPHIRAYSTDRKRSFEILNSLNGMVRYRCKSANQLCPIYIIIDDFAEMVNANNNFIYQVNRLARCEEAANIKLWLFSSSFKFNDCLLTPNIHTGTALQGGKWEQTSNRLAYHTDDHWGVYDIVPLSVEDLHERILWWCKQHTRSGYDRLFDIHPDKTLYSYLYRLSPASSDSVRLKVEEMSGLEYESYVAAKLRTMGYKNVSVTPGSGDYGADVIGYDKNGVKTCFQCKKYQGAVGVSAVQEIIAAKAYYGCEKAVVITTAIFTPNARNLAEKAGVKLISNFY